MNLEQARFNMIEQQIRPWDVLDQRVLDTLGELPRDRFVADQYRNLAYCDASIPIGQGESMMCPTVEGRMLQALRLDDSASVLEIGTGSGYVTACLAALAREVLSVEIHADLSATAAARLDELDVGNAVLEIGDAAAGWGGERRFDAIAITGSLPRIPQSFRDRMDVGGRLFAVCGTPARPVMEALLVTRISDREWSQESLFETYLAPLTNAVAVPAFEF